MIYKLVTALLKCFIYIKTWISTFSVLIEIRQIVLFGRMDLLDDSDDRLGTSASYSQSSAKNLGVILHHSFKIHRSTQWAKLAF